MKTFSATVFLTMFSFIPLQAKAIQIEVSERTLVPGTRRDAFRNLAHSGRGEKAGGHSLADLSKKGRFS